MCSGRGDTPSGCRVSPFGHPRIEARSAAPRGLSQPPTSFFGFRRQGIHRWLFVAWKTKMLVLAMEFSRGERAEENDAERVVRVDANGRSLKTEQRGPDHRRLPSKRPKPTAARDPRRAD